MTALLDLIPRPVLLALLLAVSLLAGVQSVRLSRSAAALAELRTVIATERQRAADAAATASEAARLEEHRRTAAQQEIAHEAETDRRGAAVAAARAGVAGNGLRVRAAAVAAGCHPAAADPAAAGAGPPAANAALVLADMLGRLEVAGRQLAAIADERGIAGAACQRAYDSLTQEPATMTDIAAAPTGLDLIRGAVAHHTDIDIDLIVPGARLDALDIDSLTLAEMLFYIEDRSGKTIEPETKPETVDDLVALIEASPQRVRP